MSTRWARTGQACRRLTTSSAEDITPTFTADGKSIFFGSSRGRGIYSGDLWVMKTDGSNQHRLVAGAVKRTSNGRACTFTGTVTVDTLVATRVADVICGFAGDDGELGLKGNDVIEGGPGKDLLDGGAGNDLILARDGHKDTVRGGPGFDRARLDRGLDQVSGVEKILP